MKAATSPAAVAASGAAPGEAIIHSDGQMLVRPGSGEVLGIR